MNFVQFSSESRRTLEGGTVLDGYMQAPHVEHPAEQKQSLAAVMNKQRGDFGSL